MKRAVLAFALAFAGASVEANVVVRLALDSHKTLPSVPVGLTLIAENSGSDPVRLPNTVWMRVDRGDGRTLLLPASESSDGPDGVPISEDQRTIPAHSTRTICRIEPTLFLTGTPWLSHSLISGPGTFLLYAVLAEGPPDVGDSRITSNAERLVAAPFNDTDRAAWEWLLKKGQGRWSGTSWTTSEWADEMLTRFPESNYAPYALALAAAGNGSDPHDTVVRRVLSAFPQFPLAEDLELELARRHRQTSQLLQQQDAQRSLAHADAARALASDVAAHTSSVRRRLLAEEILAHTPSRHDDKKSDSK